MLLTPNLMARKVNISSGIRIQSASCTPDSLTTPFYRQVTADTSDTSGSNTPSYERTVAKWEQQISGKKCSGSTRQLTAPSLLVSEHERMASLNGYFYRSDWNSSTPPLPQALPNNKQKTLCNTLRDAANHPPCLGENASNDSRKVRPEELKNLI